MLPLLAIMALGIFDFGIGWRQTRIMSSALGNAARQVASTQDGRHADMFALQSFMATMNDTQSTTVSKVVIYRANTSGDPFNAACLTTAPLSTVTGFNGNCNIYGPVQLANLTTAHFGNATDGVCNAAHYDARWCPKLRKVHQGDPPDFVGVYAQATFEPLSQAWGSTYTFTDHVVTQIEPKVV